MTSSVCLIYVIWICIQNLVAQAFAGDNVIEEEFIKEKEKIVQEGTPQDKDVTLPGWGVWGGSGVKNPFPKMYVIYQWAAYLLPDHMLIFLNSCCIFNWVMVCILQSKDRNSPRS